MDGLLQFLETNLPWLIQYKYLLLFLGAILEGLNTLVFGGFLASVHKLNVWGTFLLLLIGHSISGYVWYAVGYFAGGKSIDRWVRKDEKGRKIIVKVEEYFHKYSARALVFTKLTFSLTIATLITAGSLKYDLKKFSLFSFLGSVCWVSLTFFIGYFFGQSYKFFLEYIKGFLLFVLFLGGAIALVYIIKLILGSAFIKSLFITDKIKEFSYKIRDGLEEFLSNDKDDDKS